MYICVYIDRHISRLLGYKSKQAYGQHVSHPAALSLLSLDLEPLNPKGFRVLGFRIQGSGQNPMLYLPKASAPCGYFRATFFKLAGAVSKLDLLPKTVHSPLYGHAELQWF